MRIFGRCTADLRVLLLICPVCAQTGGACLAPVASFVRYRPVQSPAPTGPEPQLITPFGFLWPFWCGIRGFLSYSAGLPPPLAESRTPRVFCLARPEVEKILTLNVSTPSNKFTLLLNALILMRIYLTRLNFGSCRRNFVNS